MPACCTATSTTVMGRGPARPMRASPGLRPERPRLARQRRRTSGDPEVLRPGRSPFSADGGLQLLRRQSRPRGHQDLGRQAEHLVDRGAGPGVRRPGAGASPPSRTVGSTRDFVAVVRFQGPRANGMPELHKLTPRSASLQSRGLPGRAGHRRPHVGRLGQRARRDPRDRRKRLDGGPLARLRDGDVDPPRRRGGTLEALVPADSLGGARALEAARTAAATSTAVAANSSACFAPCHGDAEAGARSCQP